MEELLVAQAKASRSENEKAQECTRKLTVKVHASRIEIEKAQDVARRLDAELETALVSPPATVDLPVLSGPCFVIFRMSRK